MVLQQDGLRVESRWVFAEEKSLNFNKLDVLVLTASARVRSGAPVGFSLSFFFLTLARGVGCSLVISRMSRHRFNLRVRGCRVTSLFGLSLRKWVVLPGAAWLLVLLLVRLLVLLLGM